MLFDKKLRRLVDPDKAEEEFEKRMEGQELDKKDRPAMILAALIVFVPAVLLVIGFFVFVIWLMFGRFVW